MIQRFANNKALTRTRPSSRKFVPALRTQLASKLTLVALLGVFASGCQKQDRPGEVFVVLKSGEVIYMADIEIVCLKPRFKTDFNGWRIECQKQEAALSRQIENGSLPITEGLKQIDGKKNDLNAKIHSLSGDERSVLKTLSLLSESERNKLSSELAQTSSVLEEYAKSVEDIDKLLKENKTEIDQIKHELEAADSESTQDRQQSFIASMKEKERWARALEKRKNELLIEWSARRGFSEQEGRRLLELENQQKAELQRLDGNLCAFKAGDAEALALAREEIRKRGSELKESLDLLNQQRRKLLHDTAEEAVSELKADHRQKFYELIKKDAIAAIRTGSKGDFIVPGETAYLYAQTQRDNGEKLAWLVRVDPNSLKIKMSVSNTASAGGLGDFDEFWMLHGNLD